MTRIDRVVLGRLASRVGITVVVLFGLIALAESLNTWRFQHLSQVGGPLLGLTAIVVDAARWALGTLPVTLLIGTIIGILDLQARGELTVIKSSGASIWRIMRAPLLAVIALSFVASLFFDTAIVTARRELALNLPEVQSSDSALWLQQRGAGEDYVLVAAHVHPGGTVLEDVVVYLDRAGSGGRIHAESMELADGAWTIARGTRFRPDEPPEAVDGLRLPTTTTPGDMGVKLASPGELTIFELAAALSKRISDPRLRSGVEMRFLRLLTLPLVLCGSVLMAFAFTAGYRRGNKYGVAVLYGIVLGFVVYVITEMAAIAGDAGVLQPGFAATAPAFVAVIIGATVLLFREDGRAV